jgi:hypothetical protein
MLALEAFRTATWKAKRIVWNRGRWDPKEQVGPEFTKMEVGGYNPALGLSYGEIAARSRSMHKSQGFGVAPNRGMVEEYFKVLDGEPMKSSFLDGVELSYKKIAPLVQKARSEFRLDDPSAAVPALLEVKRALEAMHDDPLMARKLGEVRELIAGCLGLHAELRAATFAVSPGGELKVTATAVNRSRVPVELREVRFGDGVATVGKPLGANSPVEVEQATKTPTTANFVFAIAGQQLTLERPIQYAWVDPVAGERFRPIEFLPPVTLAPSAPLLLFADARGKELRVRVHASTGAAEGKVAPRAPEGWKVEPAELAYSLAKKDDEADLIFRVRPPAGETSGTLALGGSALQRIEYPHIPIITLLTDAQVKLVRADVKRAGARIGYIPGAGDEVPAALRQAGYDVTLLNDELLEHDTLRFDAIVIGVRAFNVNQKLAGFHDKLMSFVKQGGTLVAQYNTKNWISKVPAEIGPHPFNISQDRVTDENAAVELLDPKHAMLNFPNKIEPRDFENWVQERGLYFADKWDQHYIPLLAMHDSGEPDRKGGLLVAKHGKGTFVYTGIAFFRQLPAGVPGAFRLFANLIAHQK